VLFDQSGGRGVLCEAWPSVGPAVSRLDHAWAGGLSAANIVEQLPRIQAAAAGRPLAVDMEGSLRDDLDRFDLGRARRVLDLVQGFIT
jgi:hypothetical protein